MMSDEELIAEQLKKLIENGSVAEAREILTTIQVGRSPKIEHWRKVLAEPKARCAPSATGGSFREDAVWLQQHARKYQGQWVALKQGVLLGSHASRLELHRVLKHAGQLAGTMFVRIEA